MEEFQKALNYLIKNREKVIKEQEEDKVKFFEFNEFGYWITFRKELFLFDKEGFDFFNEEFNKSPYELSIEVSRGDKYLVRINTQTGKTQSFHRLFMEREIEDFCFDNSCKRGDVEVHHKFFCSVDNRKENLQVMTRKEHIELHNQFKSKEDRKA